MKLRLALVIGLLVVACVMWAGTFLMCHAASVTELLGPLEDRDFPSLTVIAVGTGSGYENPERRGPSIGVAWGKQVVLVDVGRGVTEGLRNAGIPVTQPNVVLLTNLLPLNVLGLDDLIYTGLLQEREKPIRILGPKGTRDMVDRLIASYETGERGLREALPLPNTGPLVLVEEVADGFSEELDDVTIRAGALSGGPLPALAWRFERGARSVVVSGTGWAPDALATFARATDILVHEAVYVPPPEDIENFGVIAKPDRLKQEAALHTAIEKVGALATAARARQLMLVRMRPPPLYNFQVSAIVGQTYEGRVHLPQDGDEVRP